MKSPAALVLLVTPDDARFEIGESMNVEVLS